MSTPRAKALDALAKKLKLTKRERALCEYVVAHPKATGAEAAKAAGFKGAGAALRVAASRALKKPKCVEYVAALHAALTIPTPPEATEETLVTAERILKEMARIAFFNPKRLYDANGNLLPIQAWPEDVAAAISGMEVVKRNLTAGDGLVDEVMKPRAWDKPKALEMLAKTLAMFQEKVEHTGGVEFRWVGDDEVG